MQDPDEIRRAGMRKVAIGVGLLVVVVVITILIAPMYFGQPQ
jgi:hypothetical protein